MTDAKKLGKRILYGFGKALYLFGKGLYIFSKALARAIRKDYQRYQERKRREEEVRQYYRGIEREAYVAERGRQRAIAEVRDQERARREHDRFSRWGVEMLYGKRAKRKKKRQIFDF